jgi:acyl-CoA thioester hydrolase
MQDAAIAHSDAAGCSQATREAGATWVIRSHHVEYLRPAFKGEKLVTLTWVSNFKRVRSLRKYRFLRESDHAVIAEGQTDWVFVDMTTGRPLPIPSQVAASFEIVPEDAEPVDFE